MAIDLEKSMAFSFSIAIRVVAKASASIAVGAMTCRLSTSAAADQL